MYHVYEYDYVQHTNILLCVDFKRNVQAYIESYIMNFIDEKQGIKYDTFLDSCKKGDDSITKEEWNKNIRYFCTKSENNLSKYTIKHMIKEEGYLYNTYKCKKVKSIYITRSIEDFEYEENRECDVDFETIDNFQKVIDLFKQPTNKKDGEKISKEYLYQDVVKELKTLFD